MRVLVLTNHFAEFAGSEIVALEIGQWFAQRGDEVVLAANRIGGAITEHAVGIKLTDDIEALDIGDFDLAWVHHDLLTMIPLGAFKDAAERGRLPHFALVSLSPFEPYEHVDGLLARALSAEVYANSPETAAEIARRNGWRPGAVDVRVFHNAAPSEYWTADNSAPSALHSVTSLSNHLPEELLAALDMLEREGVRTIRMGLHREYRLVQPGDIARTDAIVAIGKSAIYAIAQKKPLYMYDAFGGEGWLRRSNFGDSVEYNFSGRPGRRRLDAASIAHEIMAGFPEAAADAQRFDECFDQRFLRWDFHLQALRERALTRATWWRSFTFRQWLARGWFQVHWQTSRYKNLVMKRNYVLANPPG